MDTFRYVVALVILMSLVPAVLLWFLIHPFGAFWRRLGPSVTYFFLGVVAALMMAGVYVARGTLMVGDLGTSYATLGLGLLAMGLGTLIALQRRKHLTFRILSGFPQVSAQDYPGTLLTQGIYGKIRHPRYVEVILWVFGYALISNYLSMYLAALLTVPGLLLIVAMEERELEERFGEEWRAYRDRVPRFIPRSVWAGAKKERER
jgi:protein-S-isoprenylcysteine O-methyltransferase Ste14